ncbi:MAG: FAD-linked oxidase C-terminal domain-containing protein [Bacteroidota bacterium]
MATTPAFVQDLSTHLQGEVRADRLTRGLYATDASVYQIMPEVVVCPADEADVLRALALARTYQQQVLPRGGGTSLAGQTVAQAMVLDFSPHMNQILELNVEEKWVRVQPGMVRDELNAFLAPYGLHFAPDPATSSRANIGGMIGNNSSGTKSILYGKTVDHVLGLKVALDDGTLLETQALSPAEWQEKCQQRDREGEIYRTLTGILETQREEIQQRFPKVMRRVGGYNLDEFRAGESWNLSKLLVGSEGTLAVTLEAKLKLEPLPAYKSVCVVHYAELMEAIRSVSEMLPFQPAAIEILDHTVVNLSRQNLTTQRHCAFLEGEPAAILIVEFYDQDQEAVMDRPRAMIEHLRGKHIGYAYPLFPEGPAYEDVWTIRKKGLGLMLGLKGEAKPLPFIEDAGIPMESLPAYIGEVLAVCAAHETPAAMYAHASVGVIHVRPILDLRQEIHIQRFKAIAEATFELVKKYGGSWSGEHGDGLVRSPFNEAFFGAALYQAFRQIKSCFDPGHRLNPGKIVDAPPMVENLRYGSDYQDQLPDTHFSFSGEGGFDAAVHMCSGVGECRKILTGTMCPSFMVTRDEEQSTRGRANALRLAMSGQLGEMGLDSPRLQESLNLCLSCKACKSECPSNVDMARLKSETRQWYYQTHGISARDRMVAASHHMARRLSGPFAPLVNAFLGWSPVRWGLEKTLRLDRQRRLPAYAATSFASWFRQHQPAPEGLPVVLFVDTYLNYHEPELGKSAVRLLGKLGYQVHLAEVGCCQRPRISNGFLKLAKKEGTQTLARLIPYLEKNWPIVAIEPSCTSALVDDLPDLLTGQKGAELLPQRVKMIDVFLWESYQQGHWQAPAGASSSAWMLHGHCHQKALFGTDAMKKLLEVVAGSPVTEVDSGCCGMAGAFGYEAEHAALSKKMAERRLFPAIREKEQGTGVIACGVSCRHQIEDGTGEKALHWVQVMEQLVSP